ncbi:zinc finger protein 62 homolog isoform X3 [Anopheles albimanus]|uniref:zinc finger protein 62 homolog isoform X3 n=1 Tax=Anopheles albimanus TaxID=7167 RepID=UPI00164055D7|nr:zinc finger protein 62 homolog isoform X3 [Anopheles albimanus]
MKDRVPMMDVFDTTDFNPELILSSVLLDAGFDIVANIEELSDNMVTNDLMQQIGSSAVYAEAPTINAATSSSTSSMHGVEEASQHFLHSQMQQQQQQQQQYLQSQQGIASISSKQRPLVENNAPKFDNTSSTNNELFGSTLTKQFLPATGLPMIQTMQQQQQQQQQISQIQAPIQQQQPQQQQQQQSCRCEFCEYLQANRISLTGDHSFQCEFCGEGFSNQNSYNRHRCGSTDIQVYRCESCRHEYGTSRTMPTINSGEPRDKCDICNRNFDQSMLEDRVSCGPVPPPLPPTPISNSLASMETVPTMGVVAVPPPMGTANSSVVGNGSTSNLASSKSYNVPILLASVSSTSPAGTFRDTSNGGTSDLSAAASVRSIADSPMEHDIGTLDPFGSDSECISEYLGHESMSSGAYASTYCTGRKMECTLSESSGTTGSLLPESAKTYFVLGNVELQQPVHPTTNNSADIPPTPVSQHNANSISANGYQHRHIPLQQQTVPPPLHHHQQPPLSLPNLLHHLAPKEYEVTSLQQYDDQHYDDEDYSTMSEDEAIVPTEPYAKSPNQDHAKTELPIQDTIVDTSTKTLLPPPVTHLGNTTNQYAMHELKPPMAIDALGPIGPLSRCADEEEGGKCDSSSSLRSTGGLTQKSNAEGVPDASRVGSTDRPHKCHICERSYRNQKNLKSHLKVHEGIRAYQCEICGKNFSGSSYLVIHRRRHTGERPFKCSTCGKAFVDSRALAVHTRLHSGERLKCEKCEKTFSSVSALTVHNRLHTGIHPYKCELCSKTFPQYNNLKHHMKKHDQPTGPAEKKTPNGLCTSNSSNSTSSSSSSSSSTNTTISNYSSVSSSALEGQMHDPAAASVATHLPVPQPTQAMVPSSTTSNMFDFKCHICSKLYKSSAELQDHLSQHSKERPNQCEFCSKVFPRSSHLIIHRRRHTGERPFKCKYCDKAFVDSRALSVHTRLHTGERVKCEICEKTFASSSGLIVHRRIHTGIHPYKCDYCEKSFAQSTALKYHLKKHDTSSLPTTTTTTTVATAPGDAAAGAAAAASSAAIGSTSNQQTIPASTGGEATGGNDRYKCLTCGKLFRSSEYLVRHRRTHSGERPYQCEICGKHFSTMSYLVIHRRRHTSERPYKCTSCEKAFVDSRALQEHARLHTGDRVKCEICQKTYSSVSNLIVHRRIHSGIHPFECGSCGKSFAQKNALKYHLKKHNKQAETVKNE